MSPVPGAGRAAARPGRPVHVGQELLQAGAVLARRLRAVRQRAALFDLFYRPGCVRALDLPGTPRQPGRPQQYRRRDGATYPRSEQCRLACLAVPADAGPARAIWPPPGARAAIHRRRARPGAQRCAPRPDAPIRQTSAAALAGDLRDHALARRSDPGLSPEAVAGVGYVSVRQLHRLFARDGLTFGWWVREHRLRRCRDDLADQRLSQVTIAEIAARWGFRSAAHFSRAFRARYGITPADHRRACCLLGQVGPADSASGHSAAHGSGLRVR